MRRDSIMLVEPLDIFGGSLPRVLHCHVVGHAVGFAPLALRVVPLAVDPFFVRLPGDCVVVGELWYGRAKAFIKVAID